MYKELKHTAQLQPNHPLPGAEEMESWVKDWVERVLPNMPPEHRLIGMTPEERIAGLSPEELVRLKALPNKNVKD